MNEKEFLDIQKRCDNLKRDDFYKLYNYAHQYGMNGPSEIYESGVLSLNEIVDCLTEIQKWDLLVSHIYICRANESHFRNEVGERLESDSGFDYLWGSKVFFSDEVPDKSAYFLFLDLDYKYFSQQCIVINNLLDETEMMVRDIIL